QQLQILNDRREKYLFIHTISIFLYMFLVIVMIYFTSLSNQILIWFGSISGVIYNLYWLPQIYKNYRQKQAEVFRIFYLVLSLISIICDINSAIF
ncbi:PQ-loop domain-containing transporter, partial [Francisella tularensis subsp. holarctica]|uniref:PQ-loop domain-containing transporter n=1 Tax=Francisella tularensis TaxID=263 RepID=UPI002381ADC4